MSLYSLKNFALVSISQNANGTYLVFVKFTVFNGDTAIVEVKNTHLRHKYNIDYAHHFEV